MLVSTDVTVAIIGAMGVVGAAGFGFLGVVVQRLSNRLGEPNGHGNIVKMLTRLLAGQAGQDKRLGSLEGRMSKIERRTALLERWAEEQAEVNQLAREGRIDRRDEESP